MPIVVQISDTHLPRDVDDSVNGPDACLTATVAALEGVRADVVVLTGDITDDRSAEGCARALDAVRPLGEVVIAAAGNHDVPDAVAATFGSCRSVMLGSWRVELLDTWEPERISGRVDVAAALAQLDAAAPHPTLVALHHPPRSPSTYPAFGLAGADELVDGLLARPHVRGVVSGHLHESFERREGYLRFVGAPSTWYALRHDGPTYVRDAHGPVGAVRYDLTDDGAFRWRVVRRSR